MATNLIPALRTWLLAQGTFPYIATTCFEYQLPETAATSTCAIRPNSGSVDFPLKRPSIEIEVREQSGMAAALTKLDAIYELVKDTEMELDSLKTLCMAQSLPLPMGYDAKNYAHASLFIILVSPM